MYIAEMQTGSILFLKFATYVVMFPKLISGPITRYQEIRSQLIRRRFSMNRLETGLREFTMLIIASLHAASRPW